MGWALLVLLCGHSSASRQAGRSSTPTFKLNIMFNQIKRGLGKKILI